MSFRLNGFSVDFGIRRERQGAFSDLLSFGYILLSVCYLSSEFLTANGYEAVKITLFS